MKKCILINSYPINEKKIKVLEKQILSFKALNIPIILCSGCEVPQSIYSMVDYIVINKEKEIKPASFYRNAYCSGLRCVACFTFNVSNIKHIVFQDSTDLIINRNIKFLFNTANFLGFDHAYYTEDDILVNVNQLQDFFDILNVKKMCAITGEFSYEKMLYTTNFFANIKFVVENLQYPDKYEDCNLPQNLYNIGTHKIYEVAFYNCFKHKNDDIYEIKLEDFPYLNGNEESNSRHTSINFQATQSFFLTKSVTGSVYAMYYNTTSTEIYNVKIHINENLVYDGSMGPRSWYQTRNIDPNTKVSIQLTDKNNMSVINTIVYDTDDKILCISHIE